MFCKLDSRKRTFKEYTLILPCVSVGNVGQLTADLLISTLWMSRVGYIYHDAVLPLVGNDPFAHPDATTCKLTTSCEVYESSVNKLLVIQQRSPFVKGRRVAFINDLLDWIEEHEFCQVIALTSSQAHERLDKQLTGSQFRYLATPSVDRNVAGFLRDTLHWIEVELRPLATRDSIPPPGGATDGLYIPGGGIAVPFYRQCEDRQVPLVVLMVFCSEGDNATEALSLATHVNDWLGVIDLKAHSSTNDAKTSRKNPALMKDTSVMAKSWKIPSSWRLTFGNSVDASLFS